MSASLHIKAGSVVKACERFRKEAKRDYTAVSSSAFSKEKKLIKKIEKLEKELQKEHKNERMEKRKTGHAFEKIIKTIKKYEKRGILSHNDAEELMAIIEQIKAIVVE